MDKKIVLAYCQEHVDDRIQEIQTAIGDAEFALQEETKSSAGDKYETSREMIQQDLNRYQQQLFLARQDVDTLDKLSTIKQTAVIGLGSLVQMDTSYYFIAVSIGLLKIEDDQVFVISPKSPIGQLLIGKSVGDTFDFNGKQHKIVKVV